MLYKFRSKTTIYFTANILRNIIKMLTNFGPTCVISNFIKIFYQMFVIARGRFFRKKILENASAKVGIFEKSKIAFLYRILFAIIPEWLFEENMMQNSK